eukprot:286648-Chlamydomonas_euryale.AAC.1
MCGRSGRVWSACAPRRRHRVSAARAPCGEGECVAGWWVVGRFCGRAPARGAPPCEEAGCGEVRGQSAGLGVARRLVRRRSVGK